MELEFLGFKCKVELSRYDSGHNRIDLRDVEDMQPVLTASCIPSNTVAEQSTVWIKDWSENKGIKDVLIKEGIIGEELDRKPTGFAETTKHEILI